MYFARRILKFVYGPVFSWWWMRETW